MTGRDRRFEDQAAKIKGAIALRIVNEDDCLGADLQAYLAGPHVRGWTVVWNLPPRCPDDGEEARK